MKKLLLISAITVFTFSGFSQEWDGPGTSDLQNYIFRYGNVAIGSEDADEKLHVKGNIRWYNSRLLYDQGGAIQLKAVEEGQTPYFDFYSYGAQSPDARFILKNNKHFVLHAYTFGIGTNSPDEKLTVKGSIHCEEVRVDLNIPADYVFEKYYLGYSLLKPEYNMPSLDDLEKFIIENHHLPEVPSAQEIQDEGLHLKEMTNLLLQKIEELTLYTIEQEKRIQALEELLAEKQ